MNVTVEQLFAKIGALTMERDLLAQDNDTLRAEVNRLTAAPLVETSPPDEENDN